MSRVRYSIRDWNDHFENAASRKVESLSWVAMPIKHDGKSFRRIMLRPDAGDIFAAWVLIVQVGAKCPVRGVLADADGPLDATDLAIKTGFKEESFSTALKVLSSKQIGWIESIELVAGYEPSSSALALQGGKEGKERKDLCGDDATDGTANANGRPDGSTARATPNASDNGGDNADETTGRANGESYPQLFEEFWLAYPTRGGRKRGKGKCYGIWRQAIRAAERQSLVEAARIYAASDDSTRGFAKDPERFLYKDWWRDWLSEPESATESIYPEYGK